MSPTYGNHVEDKPSPNKKKVQGKKKKLKFPCMLCMRHNFTFHCPHKDKASQLLEDCVIAK